MVKRLALLFALLFAFPAFGQVAVGVPSGPVGGLGPVVPQNNFFVLDHLASYPSEALSVRQLTAGQYLPAYDMTVRRASDNATSNIGFVNGLLNTTALTTFCAATNCYVVAWKNQGSLGSSGDATQSTAASQPQIVASGVVETQNGVPSVLFTSSTFMNFSGPTTENYTVNAVWQKTAAGNNGILIGGIATYQFLRVDANGNPHVFMAGNDLTSSTVWNLLSLGITTFTRSGGTVLPYLNGVAAASIAGNGTSSYLITSINGVSSGSGASGLSLSETIIEAAIISSQDQTPLEVNQGQFFKISGVTQ